MHLTVEFVEVCLFASTVGTVLSLFWYKATQKEELDRETITFFVKPWYGLGGIASVIGVLLKYG
jgi:hypothetical protein